jgi:hypothetical protein
MNLLAFSVELVLVLVLVLGLGSGVVPCSARSEGVCVGRVWA